MYLSKKLASSIYIGCFLSILTQAQQPLFKQDLSFNNLNLLQQQHYQHLNDEVQQATYSFDALGRLTQALTTQYDSTYQNILHSNRHNTYYQHDLNGNLTNLTRYGQTTYTSPIAYGIMDSLQYLYAPGNNQLQSVHDAGAITGYNEHTLSNNKYWYDANGSLTSDSNASLQIHYNLLLKVDSIVSDTGGTLTYTYDVTGLKVRQQQRNAQGTTTFQRLYNGGITYRASPQGGWQLERIVAGNVSYVAKPNGLQTEYNILDYLGNTHLSLADQNQNGWIDANDVQQQQHYYPYGLEKTDLNTVALSTSKENPYKYNGGEPDGPIKQRMEEMQLPIREEQSTQSHTFFRTIDRVLGRWHQIDPKHHPLESAYVSMGNNPVMFTDFLGDIPSTDTTFTNAIPTHYGYKDLKNIYTNRLPQNNLALKIVDKLWLEKYRKQSTDFRLYHPPAAPIIEYTGRHVFMSKTSLYTWQVAWETTNGDWILAAFSNERVHYETGEVTQDHGVMGINPPLAVRHVRLRPYYVWVDEHQKIAGFTPISTTIYGIDQVQSLTDKYSNGGMGGPSFKAPKRPRGIYKKRDINKKRKTEEKVRTVRNQGYSTNHVISNNKDHIELYVENPSVSTNPIYVGEANIYFENGSYHISDGYINTKNVFVSGMPEVKGLSYVVVKDMFDVLKNNGIDVSTITMNAQVDNLNSYTVNLDFFENLTTSELAEYGYTKPVNAAAAFTPTGKSFVNEGYKVSSVFTNSNKTYIEFIKSQ